MQARTHFFLYFFWLFTLSFDNVSYLAWVGPIDKPCIDHKNGITTDNRYQNLEPVTYRENARRSTILRGLRRVGIDPAQLRFPVLDKYLDPKNQCDPNELMDHEMRQHREV